MSDNGENIKIEGYDFAQVKNGLDQQQVENVLKELSKKCQKLVEENEKLSKNNSHLTSLTRLAEKTIIEADSLANEIKTGAESSAREMIDTARQESESVYKKSLDLLKEIGGQVSEMSKKIQELRKNDVEESSVSEDTEKLIANFFGKEKTKVPAEEATAPDNEIGLEMLPPVDINNVMEIIENLEALPEVEKVELISRVDKPLVIVCLNESLDITNTLNAMDNITEVSQSNEENPIRPTFLVKTASTSEAGYPKG